MTSTETVRAIDLDSNDVVPPPTEACPESIEPNSWTQVRRHITTSRVAGWLELLAVVPMLFTVQEVAKGPRMQFSDYWYALVNITNLDGSFHLPGLLKPINEHPLGLTELFYWLNIHLAHGDNRMLGYLVVVIAAATVLLLRRALPVALPRLVRAGIVVAVSALIFSPHGLHNYTRAMSGVAWLNANLLVVGSLLLATRSRWLPAYVLGGLASVTYGTGLAAWPALAIVAILQREPRWRRLLPLGIGGVAVLAMISLVPSLHPGDDPASDLATLLYTFFSTVGHVWTASDAGVAVVFGIIIIATYVLLLTYRETRVPELRFWWALAGYGVLTCAMIGVARKDFGIGQGLVSRYTSVSVFVSLPAIVLLARWLQCRARWDGQRLALAILAVGLIGYTLGAPAATKIRNEDRGLLAHAVALRGGFGDAVGSPLPPSDQLVPRLQALDHYPFSEHFTLGCEGPEMGSVLDLNAMTKLPGADPDSPHLPAGSVDGVAAKRNAIVVSGWATGGDDPVRCTIVVDGSGTVNGAGTSHLSRSDVSNTVSGITSDVGFQVFAPTDPANRVVVILESGAMWWLPTHTDSNAPS